jgi:hypothetical protein
LQRHGRECEIQVFLDLAGVPEGIGRIEEFSVVLLQNDTHLAGGVSRKGNQVYLAIPEKVMGPQAEPRIQLEASVRDFPSSSSYIRRNEAGKKCRPHLFPRS